MKFFRSDTRRFILIGAAIFGAAVAAILIFSLLAGSQVVRPMLQCLLLEIAVVVMAVIVVKGIPRMGMMAAEGFVRLLLGKNYVEEKQKRKQKPAPQWFRMHLTLPGKPKPIARVKRSGSKRKHELEELLPPETKNTKLKD